MLVAGSGDPIPVAPEPNYHDESAAGTMLVHETTIEHDHEIDNVAGDLAVVGDLTAESLQVVDEILAPDVTASRVFASVEMQAPKMILDTVQVGTADYRVSNKYLPQDPTAVASNEEAYQSDNTLVTRSRLDGVRIDNLQVRGRLSGYASPYPGLFFVDGTCSDVLRFVEDGYLTFQRPTEHNSENVIEFFTNPGDANPAWTLDASGTLSAYDSLQNDVSGALTDIDDLLDSIEGDSFLGGSESVYVGRAKFGFNKNSDQLTLKVLKSNHIPKVLADAGFVAADMSHSFAEMTVKRWRNSARTFYSDDTKTVKYILPATNNTDDWDNRDAPILGAAADISTLQGEMTAAEADIVALQNAGSGGPTLELLSTDTATPSVLTIKSTDPDDESSQVQLTFEMDRQSSSSDMKYTWSNSDSHDLVLNKTQNTVTTEMLRYCRTNCIVINGGAYSGVNGAAGWNGADSANCRILGELFTQRNLRFDLSSSTGSWFTPASLTDSSFAKGSFKPSNDKLWLRDDQGDWKYSELKAFGSTAASRHFHKYFDPDETAYQTYNNAFVLPDGYSTYFVQKGDGSDWTLAANETGYFVGKSVRVRLPWNPVDGATVTLYSGIHKTEYSGTNLISAVFPGYNYNGPSGRYVMINGTAWGPDMGVTYGTINCASSLGHSSRDIYRFSSTAGGGFWTRLRSQ